jgi:MFS family permease
MRRILPIIVIAQFCCTSVWFAGNAVLQNLVDTLSLDLAFLGHLTSAVQLGFISGTLTFAVLAIADRISPSKVFLICAVLASLFNLLPVFHLPSGSHLLAYRFITGFFLAGIYPVGMKIAADHFKEGLGRSLGFLVGALVLGTAIPHGIRAIGIGLEWHVVFQTTSFLCFLGGVILYLGVPDGPYRKAATTFQPTAFFHVFQNLSFRKAALGYFGHMWELYTFWAFIPMILIYFNERNSDSLPVSLWSFFIIGTGCLACIGSGWYSNKYGIKRLAILALAGSGLCCLLSPLILLYGNSNLLLIFLWIWGILVIADSPLFSTMVAQQAPFEVRGTALTIVNCIGFGITVISIQLLHVLQVKLPFPYLFVFLAIGPLLGCLNLMIKKSSEKISSSHC